MDCFLYDNAPRHERVKRLVELRMICQSIPYQSSSETDLVKWYRNLMFTYYDLVPKFLFTKYKKGKIR